ncbi:glucosaminidase domain-containing protein [Actinomyces sp. zg328]|uniref:glucosaminidase domain-containing protein n=1 Tax=Actinomyces sp. zg328 TaxID=2609287 RepID=UPI00135ACAB6
MPSRALSSAASLSLAITALGGAAIPVSTAAAAPPAGAAQAQTTGWVARGGQWYHFGLNGVRTVGWLEDGGRWYFLRADTGAMATGWVKDDHTWYYLYGSGAMATGWIKDNNTWYYLYGSGAMATGWIKDNNTWYYLYGSGAMATGWIKDNNTWYYLYGSGAMATGWIKDNNTWYYLYGSGPMATGTVPVDGRVSRFAANGAWLGYADLTPVLSAPSSSREALISSMARAYRSSGRPYPSSALSAGGAPTIEAFAGIIYDEATSEGVSPELLFCQVMKETAWLRFGGDVSIGQFNFGGLGATGGGARGASFADVRTGLRAQVQHLRAYADPSVSASSLAHPVVDPRFSYVRKGSAPYVQYLGIKENPAHVGWATDPGYGTSLAEMMRAYFG